MFAKPAMVDNGQIAIVITLRLILIGNSRKAASVVIKPITNTATHA